MDKTCRSDGDYVWYKTLSVYQLFQIAMLISPEGIRALFRLISVDLSCVFLVAKLSGFFIMSSACSASWRVMKQNYHTAVTRTWSYRYVGCVLPRREACTEQCRVLTIQTLCSTHKPVATAAKANKLLCRQCSLKLRSPASQTKARIFTVKRCVQNIAVFLCS